MCKKLCPPYERITTASEDCLQERTAALGDCLRKRT